MKAFGWYCVIAGALLLTALAVKEAQAVFILMLLTGTTAFIFWRFSKGKW